MVFMGFVFLYLRVRNLALVIALDCGWDVGQWQVPNERGNSENNLFKNAKGRPFHFSFVQRYLIFQSPSCPEAVYLSPWEFFVG